MLPPTKELIIYTKDSIMPDKAAHMHEWITHTAGGGLIVGGIFTVSEIALIFGMVISAATFLMSWYYKRKMVALAEAVKYEQDRREDDRGA